MKRTLIYLILGVMTASVMSGCSSRKLMRCPEHVSGELYWCEEP